MAITFIGSTSGSSINGGNISLTLSGIAGITTGDFVYIVSGSFGNSGAGGRIGNALGFTQDIDTVSLRTPRLRGAWKIYNSGTDGTCIVEGSTAATDAQAAVAFVFRGTSGLDVVTVLASSAGSTNPAPPAITPQSQNDCIIIAAAANIQDTTPSGTITNYLPSTPTSANNTDTNPMTVAMAYRIKVGGGGAKETPGPFNTWSSASWLAISVAIREPVVLTAGTFPQLSNWPTPRLSQFPVSARTWLQWQIPTTPSAPPTSPSWPLSIRLAYQPTEWIHTNLALGGPQPLPANQYYWPLPIPTQFPLSARTWLQWQPPVVPPVAIVVPVYDWPLPPPSEYPASGRTWTWGTSPSLIQSVTRSPIAQYDWPLPRTAPYPNSGRTWIQSTAIYIQTPPIAQYDWPLPRAYPYPLSGRTWINQGITFTPPLPANQYDWPLPQAPKFWTSGRTWTQSLGPYLPVAPQPVNQYDWPLPKILPYQQIEWTHTNLALGGPQPLPANQYDWPLPRVPQWPLSARTWLNGVPLATPVVAPIVPSYDWPLPPTAQHPISARTWIQQGITAAATPSPPPNQYDWPLPRQAAFPNSARTWVQNAIITISGDQPLNQYDWPLPNRGAPYPNSSRTWTQSIAHTLGALVPFGPYDWPLPRIAAFPNSARTFINGSITGISGDRPFNQYEWPLPRIAPYPTSGRTLINQTPIGLNAQPTGGDTFFIVM